MFNMVAVQTTLSHSFTFLSVMLFSAVCLKRDLMANTSSCPTLTSCVKRSAVRGLKRTITAMIFQRRYIYNCVSLGFSVGIATPPASHDPAVRQRLSSLCHLALSFLSCEKLTAWLIVVKVREGARDVCELRGSDLMIFGCLTALLCLAAPLCDPAVVWRVWGYH